MAVKKHHYYVLVFTSTGPKYVTKINNLTRDAHWEVENPPLEMTREDAEYLSVGLTWNGNHSVVVSSAYEIEGHPYNYSCYDIEWVKKGEK